MHQGLGGEEGGHWRRILTRIHDGKILAMETIGQVMVRATAVLRFR